MINIRKNYIFREDCQSVITAIVGNIERQRELFELGKSVDRVDVMAPFVAGFEPALKAEIDLKNNR